MAKTIFKYKLATGATFYTIAMRAGAEICHVGLDPRNSPCVWAIIDSEAPRAWVKVSVIGTGMDVPEGATFLGTFVDDPYVWHAFLHP